MNRQFQHITEWQRKVFPHATVESCAAHLKDELDEIIEAHRNSRPIDELHAEFADAYILLVGMLDRAGLTLIDLQIAVFEKMLINKERVWGQPDERGVVHHVDDTEKEQLIKKNGVENQCNHERYEMLFSAKKGLQFFCSNCRAILNPIDIIQ